MRGLSSSGGAVSASGIAVGGLLHASGTALTLAGPGALTIDANSSAGDIAITTGGDLQVSAAAPGSIALTSTGGSVAIGSVDNSGGTSAGIGAQAVSGGNAVSVTAANAIAVADSLTAGGALTMSAGGLVSLDGAATGQTIALQAADLAIGSNGSLGSATTQRISLASTSPVNLGTGASGGFAVDQAEFGRIHSGGDLLLTLFAGEGGGLFTVSNLTINAGEGGQVGTSGTFGLTSGGVLDVNGTLGIANAGSGNTLSLSRRHGRSRLCQRRARGDGRCQRANRTDRRQRPPDHFAQRVGRGGHRGQNARRDLAPPRPRRRGAQQPTCSGPAI